MQEVKQMAYNPHNSEEQKESGLKQGQIVEGVIVSIDDGTVKQFIPEGTKWDGDTNQTAINATISYKVNDEIKTFTKLFTYNEEEGKTKYHPKSNLGKFKKTYGMLPVIEQKVNIKGNEEGYGEIVL